jgi:hypothetical protein
MLQHRARECLTRLRDAEKAKGGVEEAAALDTLYKALSAAAKPAREAYAKTRVLLSAGIPVAPPAEAAKHKQVVANVAERFREKTEAATLKQGKRWRTLIEAVEEAAEAANSSLTAAWKSYVGSKLFAGPPPEEEERSLAGTPQNRQALATYGRLFEQFSRVRAVVPAAPETIAHLRKLSSDLAAIQFERNVPPAVRDFLDGTSTTNGADLDLLTDEVRQWLKAHKLMGSYVVRARVI